MLEIAKEVCIEKLKREDIPYIAKIASIYFHGLKNYYDALKWIECNFNAFPRMQYFIAKFGNDIVGYILWMEKGGFRKEAVWELEQIAVLPEYRGKGIGEKMIKESFENIKKYTHARGSKIKLILITTSAENLAQKIYSKVLGAKVECIIKDLFRSDEVIMIARNIDI